MRRALQRRRNIGFEAGKNADPQLLESPLNALCRSSPSGVMSRYRRPCWKPPHVIRFRAAVLGSCTANETQKEPLHNGGQTSGLTHI